MCNFASMKQTIEDYIRHDERFRQALLEQEGGIMKFWAQHPENEFDTDLFEGYEKQIEKDYLQANKRNRSVRSLHSLSIMKALAQRLLCVKRIYSIIL